MGRLRSGFTLIELLVVIAVIAILAAILFPVFISARDSARKAACLNYLSELGKAQLMYRNDFGDRLPLHIAWWGQFADGDYSSYYMLLARYTKTKTGSFCCPATLPVRMVLKNGQWQMPPAVPGRYWCAASGIFMALNAGQDLKERYGYPWNDANNVTSYGAFLYPPNPAAPKETWSSQCFVVSSRYRRQSKVVYLFEAIFDFVDSPDFFTLAAEEGGRLAPRHENSDAAGMLFYDGHCRTVSRQEAKTYGAVFLGYAD